MDKKGALRAIIHPRDFFKLYPRDIPKSMTADELVDCISGQMSAPWSVYIFENCYTFATSEEEARSDDSDIPATQA